MISLGVQFRVNLRLRGLLSALMIAMIAVTLSIPAQAMQLGSGQRESTTIATRALVPASSHYSYRFVGDTLQRRGNLERNWSSKSFRPLPSSSVRARAFKSLKQTVSSEPTAEINYFVGQNVPKAMESAYRKQLAQSLRFYDFTGLQGKLDVLIFTEKDLDHLAAYWDPRYSGEENYQRKSKDVEIYKTKAANRSVGGSADVRQLKDNSYPTIGIDFAMASSHRPETHLLVEHVAHEMAHAWQWHALGSAEKMFRAERFDVQTLLPCHALEGAANTLGIAAAVQFNDWYSEAADVIIRRVAKDMKITRMSNQLAVKLLEESENWQKCQAGYAVGMIASEWFVAKYGAEAFLSIYQEIGRQKSYGEVVQALTGKTKDELYKLVAPYITSAFNNALKKRG